MCETLSGARTVDDAFYQQVVDLPEALVSYGWALRPSTFDEWYQCLASISATALPQRPAGGGCLNVFTDGSCANPGYPDARYAAYAAVVVEDFAGAVSVLDAGPLPGLRQTTVRAELFAVFRVVRWAVVRRQQVMIWSDCAAVVKRFQRIVDGRSVRINSSNSDLWTAIQSDLCSAPGLIQITKVRAHQSPEQALTALEEWCFQYNGVADRVASRANTGRPRSFWELLRRHVQACCKVDEWHGKVSTTLISVSNLVFDGMGDLDVQPPEAPAAPLAPQCLALPAKPDLPAAAVRWYGQEVVQQVMDWFWGALDSPSGQSVWVASAQLFLDFVLATGHAGPVKCNGWRNGDLVPLLGLSHVSFKERVRWFGRVVRETLRHLQVPFVYSYERPHSVMIAMSSGSMALPWPLERLEAVDRWISRHTTSPFRRQSKDFDRLPLPARGKAFPG